MGGMGSSAIIDIWHEEGDEVGDHHTEHGIQTMDDVYRICTEDLLTSFPCIFCSAQSSV